MSKELRYLVWRGWCPQCGVVQGAFHWRAVHPYQRTRCPICKRPGFSAKTIGRAMHKREWTAERRRVFGRNYAYGAKAEQGGTA